MNQKARRSGARVVSRPHVPALFWYGIGALTFGLLVLSVFRIVEWDGTVMVLVPVAVMVAFSLPLILSLRQLTATAIVEGDSLVFRRFFVERWRVQRSDVYSAIPTKGMIEGPLHLIMLGGTKRVLPGTLVRGLRGTWVEALRNEVRHGAFESMSPDEARAFADVLERSAAQRNKAYGESPDERLTNWHRSKLIERIILGSTGLLSVYVLLAPADTLTWALVIANLVATIVLVLSRRFLVLAVYSGQEAVHGIVFVLISLLPGILFARAMYGWQTLAPGFATAGWSIAAVVWITAGTPPWRGLAPKHLFGGVLFSAILAASTAYWSVQMLSYANRHFDAPRGTQAEVASVLSVSERAASRSSPASLAVELGSSTSFTFGLSTRFALDRLPDGDVAVGGQCVLLLHPGWLHVRWVEVVTCRRPG